MPIKIAKRQNVAPADYRRYARSFHEAASKLAASLDIGRASDFDVPPILSAYRKAFELTLKVIALGDGTNFLPEKPDQISVSHTRSISWLSQFVRQLVKVLAWEDRFRCEEVENLGDFKKVIEEVNEIDPDFDAFLFPQPDTKDIPQFLRRLDAVLELLDRLGVEFAAEWTLRLDSDGAKPTVH